MIKEAAKQVPVVVALILWIYSIPEPVRSLFTVIFLVWLAAMCLAVIKKLTDKAKEEE